MDLVGTAEISEAWPTSLVRIHRGLQRLQSWVVDE